MTTYRANSRVDRRSVLRTAVAAASAILVPGAFGQTTQSVKRYRAAIIGHTGRGNFGHQLDVIFTDRADVELLAVADPDDAGRAKAAGRSRAPRQYADYREMLAREKPELVCIAPRWTERHHEMAMAALRAGTHLLVEKPFTTTLAEADEIITAADKAGLTIAVAHQMRLAPSIRSLKQRLDAGLIGELLHIDAWGKQDHRAGGEDMLVLGTHSFDLIRHFAGDATSCTARVRSRGKPITRADAREASEGIGLVAGDEIYAHFALANGVNATFTSRAKLRESLGPWGMRLTGSKGAVWIHTEMDPRVFVHDPGKWEAAGRRDHWAPMADDPGAGLAPDRQGFGPANQRVVDDWLSAIRSNGQPTTSAHNGMKAVEMVMAVYHAALSGRRVALPLAERGHPFGS